MKEEETLSQLKRLSEVSIGSLIKVGGKTYKFAEHGYSPYLVEQVAPGIFSTEEVEFADLVDEYRGMANHLVEVVKEVGTGSQPDLTSQLRQQLKGNSLTESLRAQVEGQKQPTLSTIQATPLASISSEGFSISHGVVKLEESPEVAKVKKAVTTADLRSQQAQQSAQQAKQAALTAGLQAQKAQAGVTQAQFNASVASQKAVQVGSQVNELAEEVNDVYDYAKAVSDVAHNALEIATKIESKQKLEEKQMNLQNALNQKLAQQKQQAGLQSQFDAALTKTTKTTGGNTMKNLFGAFKNQFGKVEGKFAFSPTTNGLALRKGLTAGFVAYDKENKSLTDVSGLTLKVDVPAFKLPVKEDAISVGDLIIHNAEFVFVTAKGDGYLETINPEKAVRGSVIPTKNALLGAAFYTVVKTLDAAGEGGFNPMLLMALDKGSDKKDLLPLLLMSGGLGGAAQGGIDPTMLMLLDGEVDDLLPLVLMQQGGVAGEGFNPLLFLATQKGGKLKEMLPLLLMQGGLGGQAGGQIDPMTMMLLAGDGDIDFTTLALMGGLGGQQGQAGGINPMMLMAMQGDGGTDMKDLLMMQAFTGQNIFGGQATQVQAPKAQGKKADK